MKIAMVTLFGSAAESERGSCQGQAYRLAAALVGEVHEVVIYSRRISAGPERPNTAPGVEVVRLEVGPAAELDEVEVFPYVGAFADVLRKALRSQRPDVLHTHGWLAGLAGLLANRQGGPPLVHTLVNRSWPPRQRPGRPGQTVQLEQLRMRRAITRRATRVIVDGPSDQLGLIQLGISRRRISVVPPGVDCDELNPDGTREPRQAPFRLLLLGPPEPIGKGPGAAIEALAGLPDTELVIIVPDPHEQSWPARFGWARELAAGLGVANRVHLVRAPEPGQRAALLRSADVALCLSASQPPDIPLLEAMACAVPVITTARADPIDAVVDHVTGLHIAPGDPRALAMTVRELLDNTAERQGWGYAGRDRAVHRYSWASIATETSRIYRQLSKGADSPAGGVATTS